MTSVTPELNEKLSSGLMACVSSWKVSWGKNRNGLGEHVEDWKSPSYHGLIFS